LPKGGIWLATRKYRHSRTVRDTKPDEFCRGLVGSESIHSKLTGMSRNYVQSTATDRPRRPEYGKGPLSGTGARV
jgi:hypothetical protein